MTDIQKTRSAAYRRACEVSVFATPERSIEDEMRDEDYDNALRQTMSSLLRRLMDAGHPTYIEGECQ
jgi:hypothetical protein